MVIRTAGPFDETTIPAGLQRAHRAPAGTWALLRIIEGSAGFSMETAPPLDRRLSSGDVQPIPPEVPHEVRLTGAVRLQVDFLAPAGASRPPRA
jgi:tellurite resistance-related uncharacterized protein